MKQQTETGPGSSGECVNNRILVAEDDVVSQIVISWILEDAGYCVTVVSDGQAAIDALRSADHGLVVMDCSMPELDGFEATKAIRGGDAGTINPDIPIIALTALGSDDDLQKCQAAGMVAHLSKPADPDQLVELVAQHLGGSVKGNLSGQQSQSGNSEPCQDAASTRTQASRKQASRKQASGDWDPKLLESIFKIFLGHVPQEVAGLEQALERGDLSELGDIGHRLRGAAAILKVSTLSALTSALEKAGKAGDLELAARITPELTKELKNLESRRKSGSGQGSV